MHRHFIRALSTLALLLSVPAFAIVGGTDDSGDDAVVAITLGDFTLCSGVLVAKNVVLTAGHCLAPLGTAEVRFGSDAAHPTARAKIAEQLTHPNYTKEGAPYDFALLRLESEVATAPVILSTDTLTQADVGAQVIHVGFGVSDESSGTGRGVKRRVSYPITQVQPEIFYSGAPGEQTCDSDSGAPALRQDGALIGIVSDGPNCHEDGWDGRVDLVAPWISDQLQAWKPAEAAPAPTPKGGCGGSGLIFATALLLFGQVSLKRARTF